jgi:hypothetical protein
MGAFERGDGSGVSFHGFSLLDSVVPSIRAVFSAS